MTVIRVEQLADTQLLVITQDGEHVFDLMDDAFVVVYEGGVMVGKAET